MKKILVLMNVLLFLIVGIVNGQTITQTNTQFPNPGFEKWKRHPASYSGSDTAQKWVPFSWHTFDEASCHLALGCGMAKYNHHSSVNYLNSTMQQFNGSGANNTKHIGIKCTSVLGVKANGALSTGQTEIGTSTATSPSNYNYSSDESSIYGSSGQKRWPFVGCPDSMAFYYYTSISNSSVQPLFKVYLHESGEFRDRANGTLWGSSTTRLIASSVDTFNRAGSANSWKRETHPFSYSHPGTQTGTTSNGNTTYDYTFIGQTNQSTHPTYGYYTALNRPSYMLASFSTDKTAGYEQQTSGDLLYIDELWCIYDKGLASVSINGTANTAALNTFNAAEYATHEPSRTYDANGNPTFNNSGSATWTYRIAIPCNDIPYVTAMPRSKLVTQFTIMQATAANGYKATIYVKHNDNSTFYYYIQFTPALPTITLNNGGTYTACEGDNITVTASGASTYSWSNGLGSGATVHPTASGSYTVTGTASNGCTATATANVTINTRPTVSITGPTSLCQGSTGTLTAVGSFASCVWDDNSTNAIRNITPNRVGQITYSVLVTGSNSCTNSASTTVNVQATPAIPTVTTKGNSNCQAPFNGNIVVTAPLGQGYTYSIDGTAFQSGSTFNGLQGGLYSITAQASTGCQSTLNGIVVNNVIEPIETEITVDNAVGSYEWNGNTYTESGDYTMTFIAANGCDSTVTLHLNFSNCTGITTLPYSENFDNFTNSTTAATGVEPTCWDLVRADVAMTDANRPQLYYMSEYAHSGSYSLRLGNRGIYAMPELASDIPVNGVKLDMYLRQPKALHQLEVGVWDGQVFVPVVTFNNSTTELEHVTCSFSSYNGNGRQIAFRNTLASGGSGNYSYNYIDDIVLIANTCKIAELPYTEDFDGYTQSTTACTGVEPTCWDLVREDVAMTDANRPQLYCKSEYAHSGSYSLRLGNRGIYAMPELASDIPVNGVKLDMYLRQPKALHQLEVGVWDGQVFVPVVTFNNSTTELEHVTCSFSSYNGNGRQIAFRNTLASGGSGNYSYNYIDDIVLIANTCKIAELPYTEDFDGYTQSTTACTGVEPTCWDLVREDVAMTDANRPQLYCKSEYAHSGSYSLRLGNRGIYAMPELASDIPVNGVKLDMYLRQPKALHQLEVGVWDGQVFVPVVTFNNSTTELEHVTCSFSSYNGNGRQIAFRNTLASGGSGNYSYNYIDDIVLIANTCKIAELPYTEDFDGYTQSTTACTGVEPTCWDLVREDVAMTDANRPQLYCKSEYAHSGSYSLRLGNRGIYAMPDLASDIAVNEVNLEMYLRQPKALHQLEVGIWDGQTFVPVATFNNSTTEVEHVTCSFSSYNGNGHQIAFRNTLVSGSGDYSYNYIDDIVLVANSCEIVEIPYTENFDGYTQSTTASTGVEPTCWNLVRADVTMTDANRPQLYCKSEYAHSGSYSLRLGNRGIYAMPELNESFSVQGLKLEMYLRQPKTYDALQVGIWEDNGTFVPVATFNNNTTEVEHVTCNFSSYNGNGHRIAFRNISGDGVVRSTSYNYLDDIKLNFNAVGKSIANDEIFFDMNADLDNITVYPNPTTGMLHIDAVDVQKVECYNQMGQLVGVYDNVNELNISELSNGIYMLRITVPQGVTMRKVVKQ